MYTFFMAKMNEILHRKNTRSDNPFINNRLNQVKTRSIYINLLDLLLILSIQSQFRYTCNLHYIFESLRYEIELRIVKFRYIQDLPYRFEQICWKIDSNRESQDFDNSGYNYFHVYLYFRGKLTVTVTEPGSYTSALNLYKYKGTYRGETF